MLILDQLTSDFPPLKMQFSFTVQQGQHLAIMGPSGAGKSTLLGLIAGFVEPQTGYLWFGKQDGTHLHPSQRPVSMLFQQNNLFTHLSVEQNLALGLHTGIRLSKIQRQQLLMIAERTGLLSYLQRTPAHLSGGQRQRVALARCLLRKKPLLLLDEPFSALDPALRDEMLLLTRQICEERQMTLIMVTHNLSDASRISQRSIIINNGQIDWDGATKQLLAGQSPAGHLLGINAEQSATDNLPQQMGK